MLGFKGLSLLIMSNIIILCSLSPPFFHTQMLFSALSRSPLYSSSSVLVLSPSLHIAANLIPTSLVDKADGIAAISWYQWFNSLSLPIPMPLPSP